MTSELRIRLIIFKETNTFLSDILLVVYVRQWLCGNGYSLTMRTQVSLVQISLKKLYTLYR